MDPLRSISAVAASGMHAQGERPRIHGWLYRVEDGTIDILVDGRGSQTTA